MRSKTIITLCLLSIFAIATMSCEKKVKESQFNQSKAKAQDFTMSFSPTEHIKVYDGIKFFNQGDIILLYVWTTHSQFDDDDYWGLLPTITAHYKSKTGNVLWDYDYSHQTGKIVISTYPADNTTDNPWLESGTWAFKAVIIKPELIAGMPQVDFEDYNQVKYILELE